MHNPNDRPQFNVIVSETLRAEGFRECVWISLESMTLFVSSHPEIWRISPSELRAENDSSRVNPMIQSLDNRGLAWNEKICERQTCWPLMLFTLYYKRETFSLVSHVVIDHDFILAGQYLSHKQWICLTTETASHYSWPIIFRVIVLLFFTSLD